MTTPYTARFIDCATGKAHTAVILAPTLGEALNCLLADYGPHGLYLKSLAPVGPRPPRRSAVDALTMESSI